MYRHQLNLVVHSVHEDDSYQDIDDLSKRHDINGILDQIAREKAATRSVKAQLEEQTPPRTENSSRKSLFKAPFNFRLPCRVSRRK